MDQCNSFGGPCPTLKTQSIDAINQCTQKARVRETVEGCKCLSPILTPMFCLSISLARSPWIAQNRAPCTSRMQPYPARSSTRYDGEQLLCHQGLRRRWWPKGWISRLTPGYLCTLDWLLYCCGPSCCQYACSSIYWSGCSVCSMRCVFSVYARQNRSHGLIIRIDRFVGGIGFSGPTTCVAPYKCTSINQYYSQCL